jgi:ribokinase
MGFGGKGGNQAVSAARLDAEVILISKVGQDVFGRQLLDNYRALGLDTRLVFQDECLHSGVASIVVDDSAENRIIVVPGANLLLNQADVEKADDAIRSADVVLGQLEVPLETIEKAFQMAQHAGVRTVLNPAPARTLPASLLQQTDICVLNEIELYIVTGRSCDERTSDSVNAVRAAAEDLRENGPSTVIVTLGEQGALVLSEDLVEHVPGFLVAAVDTAGAGDAFIGALAVFLIEGRTLLEAVRGAHAVAAISVTRPGTQTSFPTRVEFEHFLQEFQVAGC